MKCCRDLSTIKICSASRPSFHLNSTDAAAAAVDNDMLWGHHDAAATRPLASTPHPPQLSGITICEDLGDHDYDEDDDESRPIAF